MRPSVRDVLLVSLAPLTVLLIGLAYVGGSTSETDASGHTTSQFIGLTGAPALGSTPARSSRWPYRC